MAESVRHFNGAVYLHLEIGHSVSPLSALIPFMGSLNSHRRSKIIKNITRFPFHPLAKICDAKMWNFKILYLFIASRILRLIEKSSFSLP
jgi:hypothetical protein